ncbi:hypothetical protein [Mucilaginibacter arboris]|uniref:Uncharacterized protein n=1 Tax=Mucilaginibacter arboris TaxID=2682090 RepID=A0A7K1SX77_9SPHI|nr:hypothetical protein [Mucilaginibacter arboris]MVN21903.1 hypothetical protein [Mucilaginibacter arboris]
MMSIPKFTLFEHRLEEKYTAIVQELPEMIKALRLSNSLEDGNLNKIKKDIFDDLSGQWGFSDFEVKVPDISVQNQEYEFEKSVAGDIMGENSIASLRSVTDYIKLYYAIYTVPYTGTINALKYTTIYPKEEVYLTDHSGYFSLTVYSVKPIKESAEEIKHAKDRVLDLLKKNQEANKAYIKSKDDALKDAIDKEIDFHFKSGRDEINDNNLLL